jgi:hypothetical protein
LQYYKNGITGREVVVEGYSPTILQVSGTRRTLQGGVEELVGLLDLRRGQSSAFSARAGGGP